MLYQASPSSDADGLVAWGGGGRPHIYCAEDCLFI